MEFRKSTKTDIPQIMSIIQQAQAYFKEHKIDQWQNNYPNEEGILHDIEKGNSYVMLNAGQIVATTVISFEKEKAYEQIYEGRWLTNGDSGVIHRVAVDHRYKGSGLFHEIIQYTEQICFSQGVHSIKVDTHKENTSMQKALHKNGFQSCGIIYLESGGERIAFEKMI